MKNSKDKGKFKFKLDINFRKMEYKVKIIEIVINLRWI